MSGVVTLHTVLAAEPDREKSEELCALADRVTVFTDSSRTLLLENHPMDPAKVAVVPHGAPPELFADCAEEPASTRISTFGLLSDNKGLELLLSALPTVVREYPDVFVTVAGRTHPEVHRREGERYRQSLIDMVARLISNGCEFRINFFDKSWRASQRHGDLRPRRSVARTVVCGRSLSRSPLVSRSVYAVPVLRRHAVFGRGTTRTVVTPTRWPTSALLLRDPPSCRRCAMRPTASGAVVLAGGRATLPSFSTCVEIDPGRRCSSLMTDRELSPRTAAPSPSVVEHLVRLFVT